MGNGKIDENLNAFNRTDLTDFATYSVNVNVGINSLKIELTNTILA